MEFESILKAGLKAEKTETVNDENTADSWKSGGLAVYATPCMIALMEGAAFAAVQDQLPAGWSTVGTELQVKHVSSTPPGIQVRACAELLSINGRALLFKVTAFDEAGLIGEGTHERFIIEIERFLKKTSQKKHFD
jgi:predicted thioesterase